MLLFQVFGVAHKVPVCSVMCMVDVQATTHMVQAAFGREPGLGTRGVPRLAGGTPSQRPETEAGVTTCKRTAWQTGPAL